ncbi:hypothetical protein CEP52_005073 [Fusarium oligoseptatum]|uniref:Uncharacterized protein n=1 Tax=Fusarium oligoseptatum TaxID=2604345 RepID=A0A428U0J0_9HYPO|nr:hypothetical protein CEP52_005073 [Fusarium oligoseptatum]
MAHAPILYSSHAQMPHTFVFPIPSISQPFSVLLPQTLGGYLYARQFKYLGMAVATSASTNASAASVSVIAGPYLGAQSLCQHPGLPPPFAPPPALPLGLTRSGLSLLAGPEIPGLVNIAALQECPGTFALQTSTSLQTYLHSSELGRSALHCLFTSKVHLYKEAGPSPLCVCDCVRVSTRLCHLQPVLLLLVVPLALALALGLRLWTYRVFKKRPRPGKAESHLASPLPYLPRQGLIPSRSPSVFVHKCASLRQTLPPAATTPTAVHHFSQKHSIPQPR